MAYPTGLILNFNCLFKVTLLKYSHILSCLRIRITYEQEVGGTVQSIRMCGAIYLRGLSGAAILDSASRRFSCRHFMTVVRIGFQE